MMMKLRPAESKSNHLHFIYGSQYLVADVQSLRICWWNLIGSGSDPSPTTYLGGILYIFDPCGNIEVRR